MSAIVGLGRDLLVGVHVDADTQNALRAAGRQAHGLAFHDGRNTDARKRCLAGQRQRQGG
jgi:hypothetical protein